MSIGEDIGMYLGIFLAGESVPRGSGVGGLKRCQEIIY